MDENVEPKLKASIVVRPAYVTAGELPYITSSQRWIGELYVNGEKRVETIDYDREGAAYIGVCKDIRRKPELLDP